MQRSLTPFWTLFILTGLNLFNYLDRFVLPAVLPPLQKDLHLNDAQAGTIGTAFMIGYFVTSPFFGWLGDRFSRKWLIALGIFIWSLGTVLTGFAGSFTMLLGFRVLVGVGEASYATISPGVISDSFPAAKRNNALTIFYVAIPVGDYSFERYTGQFSTNQRRKISGRPGASTAGRAMTMPAAASRMSNGRGSISLRVGQ